MNLDWLENNLRQEVIGVKNIFWFLLGCFVVESFYVGAFSFFMWSFFPEVHGSLSSGEPFFYLLTWRFPFVLFFFALAEELLFRFLFLADAVKYDASLKIVIGLSIISSVLFGFVHGGAIKIPMQGVFGLVFCYVYLRCGGFQGRFVKATLCSTLSHFLWNGSIALIAISKGETML